MGACVWRQSPGPGIMATYVDILKSEFPEIDSELFDYITGRRPGSGPLCSREQSPYPARPGGDTAASGPPVSREGTALS